jgi:hypothetical protein
MSCANRLFVGEKSYCSLPYTLRVQLMFPAVTIMDAPNRAPLMFAFAHY